MSFQAGLVVFLSQAHQTNKNHLERKSTRNVLAFFKGASAKQVKIDDLSPDDIIIACVISRGLPQALFYSVYLCSVMGPSGSGKSSVRPSHISKGYFSLTWATPVHKRHHRPRNRVGA